MTLSRWSNRTFALIALSLSLLFLAACEGNAQKAQSSPTPSPTLVQGQQLLAKTSNALNSAKTLQGVLNLTIHGQSQNGTLNTTIWNAAPAKNRTEVHQSTLSQLPAGTVTVTDGKQLWQYNPTKNVVYSGSVQPSSGGGLFGFAGTGSGGQSQFLLNFVQSVFTSSTGTLKSATATINGHAVYDIGVVPQDSSSSTIGNVGGSFNYSGDVYIDKVTQLPVEVNLDIQGFGKTVLDFQKLVLDQPIPASTFNFVVPAGTKELPLQQATQTANSNLISLAQAQQQAGFHLLSIPGAQADYVLLGVNALGAPGSQIYTLHYMKGNTSFTIAEGKPLANLSASGGQHVSMRSTTALFSDQGGSNVLSWTEKGVGINVTGLSQEQAVAIAKTLT
jgi:outer membrane lipoprotein-sorting protein